jgi:hypothetical protein
MQRLWSYERVSESEQLHKGIRVPRKKEAGGK